MKNKFYRHFILNTMVLLSALSYGVAVANSCRCMLPGPGIAASSCVKESQPVDSCCSIKIQKPKTSCCSKAKETKTSKTTCCKSIKCMAISKQETIVQRLRQDVTVIAINPQQTVRFYNRAEFITPAQTQAYDDTGPANLCVFLC